MFGERAQWNDFALFLTHFGHHFCHQLLTHTLPFQALIHIGVLDNAQMFTGRYEDNLGNLVTVSIVDVKLVMAFQNIHGSSLIFGDTSAHRSGRYQSRLQPFQRPLHRE